MHFQKLYAVALLYLSLSTQAQAATLKIAVGSGIQYGGILGWQGSVVFNANKLRMSYGYTGLAWGYDRYLGSNTSLGLQVFGNQYKTGTALSLNYFFNPHQSAGWIVGLDLYRAYDSGEFELEFFKDFILNPEDIDIDAEIDNGIFISVGYQF